MSKVFRSTAPTRADISGGTLDLWPLYCLTGKARTVNLALNLFAEVEFEVEPASKWEVTVSAFGKSAKIDQWPLTEDKLSQLEKAVQFPAFVAGEFIKSHLDSPLNIKLDVQSQAPMGSGLGGSSSLCVALIRGFSEAVAEEINENYPWKKLHWAKDVEAGYLKLPTGTQDYLAAFWGGLRCYEFGNGEISQSAYDQSHLEALSERVGVLFSGEAHHSGLSNWEVFKKAFENDSKVLKGLSEIRELSEEVHTNLSKSNPSWEALGKAMIEEWEIRKNTFQVDTKRLDEIFEFLKNFHGVLGAKVCGAAQGGSFLVLTDGPDSLAKVKEACTRKEISVLNANPCASGVQIL